MLTDRFDIQRVPNCVSGGRLTTLAFWLRVDSVPLLVGIFFIAGLYVAVQEALGSTVTAEMVQPDTLVMSYGALGTVTVLPSSFPARQSVWCGRRSHRCYHFATASAIEIPCLDSLTLRLRGRTRVDDRCILVLIRCEVESLPTLIGVAIVVFASTNIDDAFVLVAFFADKNFSASDVVIGQYGGMGLMLAVSVIAALISLTIAPAYVGLLGLAPIAIGVRKLYSLRQRWKKEEDPGRVSSTGAHRRILAVAAVTLANGGDNIATYTALFATISRSEIPAIGIAFAVMTGLWCLAAYWLVNHGAVGAPVRYHAHRVVPFVLIGLGILILIRSGTVQLLKEYLLSTPQMLTKTLSS